MPLRLCEAWAGSPRPGWTSERGICWGPEELGLRSVYAMYECTGLSYTLLFICSAVPLGPGGPAPHGPGPSGLLEHRNGWGKVCTTTYRDHLAVTLLLWGSRHPPNSSPLPQSSSEREARPPPGLTRFKRRKGRPLWAAPLVSRDPLNSTREALNTANSQRTGPGQAARKRGLWTRDPNR